MTFTDSATAAAEHLIRFCETVHGEDVTMHDLSGALKASTDGGYELMLICSMLASLSLESIIIEKEKE